MSYPPYVACVFAGGEGTRLGPLTRNCPKPMLPFCGVPFLHLQMEKLLREGCSRLIVVAGYLPEVIEEYVSNHFRDEGRITVVRQEGEGTVAALKAAVAHREPQDHLILTVNGDTILDIDHGAVAQRHLQSKAVLTIVTTDLPDVPNYRAIEIDENGWVTGFFEQDPIATRPSEVSEPHRLVTNCGCYCFDLDTLISRIATTTHSIIEHGIIPDLVMRDPVLSFGNGMRMFLDFGTPERLADAQARTDEIRHIYRADGPH